MYIEEEKLSQRSTYFNYEYILIKLHLQIIAVILGCHT